jgi:Flp pilus assembly protein TadD
LDVSPGVAPAALAVVPAGDNALAADTLAGGASEARQPSLTPSTARKDYLLADADPPRAPEKAPDAGPPPTSVDEHVAHGSLLIHQGRSKEAIADFERATELDPTSAGARAGLALAEAWSDDGAAAAIDLDKAATLNPNEPLVYDGRAVLAQKSGRAAEAIADYGQALALNPADEFARDPQSGLAALLGRPDPSLANTESHRPATPQP